MSSNVTRLNPSTMRDSTVNGHSQISIAEPGRLALLSGQVAALKDRATLPKSVGGQAALVADSLQAALHELGATPADIVMLRIHVVNGTTERFTEAYSQIQKLLNGEMPSVTVLGVQALFTPELQIEVEMTVRVPSTAER